MSSSLMVTVKVVHSDELLVHTLAGVGVTPEGEQFAVFNLVWESGVMVQFCQDDRFRYKVLMKDCISAIKDFHEEYRDALLTAAAPPGGGEETDGRGAGGREVDAVQHGGPEVRLAGE
jgi:hypothetical protein